MARQTTQRLASAVLVAILALASGPTRPAFAEGWAAFYPEGPTWIDGKLYWAEMQADRVMRLDATTPTVFFERPGCGPTAIARYRTDDLLVLCHLEGAVLHVSADGDPVENIKRSAGGHVLRNPNDATADGAGGVWFTDPGRFSAMAPAEGAIYHLSSHGVLTRHVTGLAYGNGVHVDNRTARLLVSEHLGGRVLAYPLTPEGLGPQTVLFDFDDLDLPSSDYREAGPDGLEIGPDGILWVAVYGTARVIGWDPVGGLVSVREVAPKFITNLAFGPEGAVALTGSFENNRRANRGRVWLISREDLGP